MTSASESPLAFLQLVGDEVRWDLVGHLARSDRRVGELVELSGKAQNLVSYHLRELRSAGLVSARRSSADGRDTYYRLELTRFGELFVAAGAAIHPSLRLAAFGGHAELMKRRKLRVLFLCTGNSARSQMAEALLTARTDGGVVARSAGSHPKALHPNAVRVMAERGIDISGRPTTRLDRYARTRFDRVVTMCDKVREVCPEFPGAPVMAHWSMPDPAAAAIADDDSYPEFVRAAEEIEVRVEHLVAELAEITNRRSRHDGR